MEGESRETERNINNCLYLSYTMGVAVTVRKWGNSLGIILPKDYLTQRHIKEDDEIIVEAFKPADLSDIFGSRKLKISGQKLKDLVREGSM